MISPQHSRNTVATSRLTVQLSSRQQQQQQIDHILNEYRNLFQELDRVHLHCQVKNSIELVLGSSLPNVSIYR